MPIDDERRRVAAWRPSCPECAHRNVCRFNDETWTGSCNQFDPTVDWRALLDVAEEMNAAADAAASSGCGGLSVVDVCIWARRVRYACGEEK